MTIALLALMACTVPPESCEDLVDGAIELSEDPESPTGRILKLYDVQPLDPDSRIAKALDERKSPDELLIFECGARARLAKGGDEDIAFYLSRDKDGDEFIGLIKP